MDKESEGITYNQYNQYLIDIIDFYKGKSLDGI
jgi:hypothetical protein